jgi:DNA-binding transcriptional LysR family regulator
VIEPLLSGFLAAYPEIVLDLTLSDGLNDIVAEGFDAGIRLGETLDKDMVALRVSADERSAIVGAPDYFRVHGKPQHPRELHAHSCINYRLVTRGTVYRWEFSDGGQELEISVEGRLIVNDSALLLTAARQGLGLAYVLESNAAAELAAGQLVRVLDEFCPPFPGFFLYYSSRTHLAPKLRALIDFLKARRRRPRRGREQARAAARK